MSDVWLFNSVLSASWLCLTCVLTADWVFLDCALIMWVIYLSTPALVRVSRCLMQGFIWRVCPPPPPYLTVMAAISTVETEKSSEHPPRKPLWQHCVWTTLTTPSLSFDSFVGFLLVPLLFLIFVLCIPYFASSLHIYCWIETSFLSTIFRIKSL